MTTTQTVILDTQYISDSATNYVATNKTIVDKVTVTNVTTGRVVYDAHIINSGDALGVVNKIIDGRGVEPSRNDYAYELVGHVLDAGDAFSFVAGAADSLNIRVSGRVIT